MKEKVRSFEDTRKEELKRIEKRLNELLEYRNNRDEDSFRSYRAQDKIVRTAIDNEIRALNIKRRQMQFDSETIKKDLRDAIMNVLKYYGVEEELPEIEEKFNRYKEHDRLETVLDELGNAIGHKVKWDAYRKDYLY